MKPCNKINCEYYDEDYESKCFIRSLKGVEQCSEHLQDEILKSDCLHKGMKYIDFSSGYYWIICYDCNLKLACYRNEDIAQIEMRKMGS